MAIGALMANPALASFALFFSFFSSTKEAHIDHRLSPIWFKDRLAYFLRVKYAP